MCQIVCGVMSFLIDDVRFACLKAIIAYRDCKISLTPAVKIRELRVVFEPPATPLLNVSHQICERNRGMEVDQHVDMIGDAIDSY